MVLGRFSEMALSPALLLGFRHIIHQMKAYNFFSINRCDSTGSCFGLKDRRQLSTAILLRSLLTSLCILSIRSYI